MGTATDRYLDAVKDRLNITSDYALAKAWGVSHQRIGNYRRGDTALGEDRCLQVAEILGLPPEDVLFEIQAERARNLGNTRIAEIFERVLRQLHAGVAALLFLAVSGLAFAPTESHAAYGESHSALLRLHLTDNANYANPR